MAKPGTPGGRSEGNALETSPQTKANKRPLDLQPISGKESNRPPKKDTTAPMTFMHGLQGHAPRLRVDQWQHAHDAAHQDAWRQMSSPFSEHDMAGSKIG